MKHIHRGIRQALAAALRRLAVVGIALLTAACAGLPPRSADTVHSSRAIGASDAAATPLGAVAAAALDGSAPSGFRLLPLAASAYETRIELARRAQRTLDVQSFVFHGDQSGAYLLGALRDAAARGVRVRLLLDDLHVDSAEALLSDMSAFEGVQVRLINPFVRSRASRAAKILTSLDELSRVNHRMHNKLFAADNALAVFGGRNIGDEYFMRADSGGNFVDLDVLAAGAVVRELSASFDEQWNSEHAWPIDLIVRPAQPAAARRARFDAHLRGVEPPPADLGVPARLAPYATAPEQLRSGRLTLTGATAQVLADPVDKLAGRRVEDRAGTVRAGAGQAMGNAQSEVFVVSPYFIPGELGMQVTERNAQRRVRLKLLTNSLAATDEPAVHAGYVAYRRQMVAIGMEVYELSPTLAQKQQRLGRFGQSVGVLHAKVIVIDRARLFVGSMNLDGRSERYNTELGVLIDSPALAQDFLGMMDFESSAYRLRLGPTGALQWVHRDAEGETVLDSEPEAGLLRHWLSRLLGALLPHDWL